MNEKKNNTVYMIYYLLLFSILAGTFVCLTKEETKYTKPIVKIKKVKYVVYIDTCNLFNQAIDHLKQHEGFRGEVYYGVNRKKTIGYGHQLTEEESFNRISRDQAEDILVEDFNKHYKRIKEELSLAENKCIALALFSFNVGSGNFNKAVDRGLLKNINRLKSYCYYKSSGVYIRSNKLRQRRLFELHIFKN